MKKYSRILYLLGVVYFLSSCQDKIEDTYEVKKPVYLPYSELRSSLKITEEQEIIQAGKIYFINDYILVNEYQKGIHLVDNAEPSNPKVIKFIEIPGNVDMAVNGSMLYADSYVDLLTIDISDINNITEVDRDTNVFPYIIPEYNGGILGQVNQSNGVIVGYTVEKVTEEVKAQTGYTTFPKWELFAQRAGNVDVFSDVGGNNSVGVGGSMARFTLYGRYLYTVDKAALKLFDISDRANPKFEKSKGIGWNIETIFPYGNKLFIGSQTGMYVYSIQDESNPEYISEFRHASACDPVVVEGDYAYVTLRGGNSCGAIESQLDVIDIKEIESPKLLKTYPMKNPYGLGIKQDVLFVCDGDAGLKIYEAKDKMKIDSNLLAAYPDVDAFDVIPLDEVLIMIGVDGLYQYDYSDLKEIRQLSHIPIYDKKGE